MDRSSPDQAVAIRPFAGWRDPWAWVSALAVVPLLARSLGAPLGEPVAEDFDFLRRALLFPANSLLDGGGSSAFWRPLSHQLYYDAFGRLMLAHPGAIAAIHVALLALCGLLLYRVFRASFGGPVAAALASFPLLAESTRTFVTWPSHFVDLGAFLFSVLAFHEAAARRWWSALPSLLAALLCKEVAVVAALLLPFVPAAHGARPRAGERMRALLGCGLVLVAWAAAYSWVRAHAGLELPHGLERDPALLHVGLASRVLWAVLNSLRAIFGLARLPGPWDAPILGAVAAILAATAWRLARSSAARERLRLRSRWVVWGFAWFALGATSLASIFPLWSPNRSQYSSLGLGAAVVTVTASAHPALAAGLVAVRLGALVVAPSGAAVVTPEPEDRGAFIDFPRITRLQRLMRATRHALTARFPTLPHGATIGFRNLPLTTEYAFGGANAVQVWYRDATLRWIGIEAWQRDPLREPVAGFVDYQPPPLATVAVLDPDALRWTKAGVDALLANHPAEAIAALDRADSLQRDRSAAIFLGDNAGRRATALLLERRFAEADAQAQVAVRASRLDVGARYVLALTAASRHQRAQALAQLDSLLAVKPGDATALTLRSQILESRELR